jgi:hypothetical protein
VPYSIQWLWAAQADYEGTLTKGFYSRAIMGEACAARASLMWWSQRDLNPCLNHAHVFAMFSDMLNDFEL